MCAGKHTSRHSKVGNAVAQRTTFKNAVYRITNSVHYFNRRAQRAFLLIFNESTTGNEGWVILNLSSESAINSASRRGMMTEMWAIAVIVLGGGRWESNYSTKWPLMKKQLGGGRGRESGRSPAHGFFCFSSLSLCLRVRRLSDWQIDRGGSYY